MENKKYDNKFNVCIVGKNNVGKSSYIKRLIDNTFINSYKKTSGIETHQIHKAIKNKNFLFKIWDISGGTKPQNISNDLYRTVDGLIFAFALNDEQSYEDIKEWIDAIIARKISLETCIVLCLKSDLESDSKFDLNIIKKTCEDYEIEFTQVSSKNNEIVGDSFESLIKKILCRNSNSIGSYSTSTQNSDSHSGCFIF
jgi:small GTP-binding protein